MDLYKEILAHALMQGEIHITLPEQYRDLSKAIECDCYQALEKIKSIIHDDSLTDQECFAKIEAIICTLEDIGSNGGGGTILVDLLTRLRQQD